MGSFYHRFYAMVRVTVCFMLIALFESCYGTTTRSRSAERKANFTRILDGLLVGYDRRLRPNFEEDPEIIKVTMHIVAISDVTESGMDLKVDFFLRQYWKDERLAFPGSGSDVTVGVDLLSQIWRPDTSFPNEKESSFHEATTHNTFLRIKPNGRIFVSQRFTVKAACPMDLRMFPMDDQDCRLGIESYGYSDADIVYHWAKNNPLTKDEDVRLPQFSLVAIGAKEFNRSLSTGNYSGLQCRFLFRRNIGYYVMQVYLPAIVVVIISALGFWFPSDLIGDRIALCVAAVLTMTVLMTTTNSTLPKISYVKAIDVYMLTSFLLIFMSLIESALSAFIIMTADEKRNNPEGSTGAAITSSENHHASSDQETSLKRRSIRRSQSGKSEGLLARKAFAKVENRWSKCLAFCEASSLDRACSIFFMVFFIVFNIVYWSIYLNINKLA